jgi:uncharacterized membrane protein (DUF106 family)
MPEQEKAHGHHSTATDKKDATEPTKGLLRWTLVVGAIGLLILIVVSIYHPYLTERVKFLVGSSLSLFVLLAVIVQAVIYRGQWNAMNEQAGVMREGLEETRNLLRQNEWAFRENHRHANATQTQMREQSEAMKGQLEAMNAQRELLQRDIESTEKSSIYAQRAYVTAKIRRVTSVTKRLDTFLMVLRIENSGNTPANDLVVMYGCGLKEKPPCEKTPDGLICESGEPYVTRLGVVAPNDSYQVIYTPRIAFVSIEDFNAFKDGKLAFYCWGRIAYEDIFNEPRHSDFCFFQSWERPDGYPCEYGNEVF